MDSPLKKLDADCTNWM